ncbi:LysM peptidoglycan-binding domain-containing protein [Marinicrinis lubricantis]|uniref:LysM peptidoglycan-binding domain-containing protein n=1 Tax=Marinicrinis lubricantis TaxID=2086470 RepID=A0ABW1IU73_9BACL
MYYQSMHYSSVSAKSTTHRRIVSYKRFAARLGLLIVLAVILVSFTYNAIAYAVNPGSANEVMTQEPKQVVVQPGDTLWGIAAEHAPEHMSHDEFIYEVRKLNDLDNSLLMVGQILLVPIS